VKQKLNIDTWVRKEHFNFFNQFEEPYHGVCVNIDCTIAYKTTKQLGTSFWLYYLYQALAAAQLIEAFKLRAEDNEVFIYNQVDAGTTIPRSNGTFGFGDFKYSPSFAEFINGATQTIQRVQNSTDLERSPAGNVIRFSALPWIDFTALSHARMFSFKDSCPKISFGKITDSNGKKTMPVSIHVHHALVDGLTLGQYIECYQELMSKPLTLIAL
jgi:chloramphenicol O-acetyltransferase type A